MANLKKTYSATSQNIDEKTNYKTTIIVKTEDAGVMQKLLANGNFKESNKEPPKTKPKSKALLKAPVKRKKGK